MMKYRILFFGTPEFAVPTLEKLIANGLSSHFATNSAKATLVKKASWDKPIAVITEPDRSAGRGGNLVMSPVKLIAKRYHIPVYQPEKISNLKSPISNLQPEVAIVVAYGQIIPKEILEIPKFGFLNIHPSLLPKYRGPSPIQAAILNGDKKTGVSIIKLDEKMDHGPILVQQELVLPSTKHQIPNPSIILGAGKFQIPINNQNLSGELSKLGAGLLVKILPDYLSGKIKLTGQDHTQASYTKLIKKSDGLIDWNEPAKTIERKIRAYNPWPSTYTVINGKRLKICQAHIDCDKLIIDQVQLEGKNQMSWDNFVKGNQNLAKLLDNKLSK